MTRKPRYSDSCAARYADGTPVAEGDMCMLGLDVRRVSAVVWGESTSSVAFSDDGLEPSSVDVATDGRTALELCVPGADGRPIHKGTLVVCDGESGDGEPWYVRRVTRSPYPVECGGKQLKAEWCRAASLDELSGMLTKAYAEEAGANRAFSDALSALLRRGM